MIDISSEECVRIKAVANQLRRMTGGRHNDGKGAYLGDGIQVGVDIRAIELANWLDALISMVDNQE